MCCGKSSAYTLLLNKFSLAGRAFPNAYNKAKAHKFRTGAAYPRPYIVPDVAFYRINIFDIHDSPSSASWPLASRTPASRTPASRLLASWTPASWTPASFGSQVSGSWVSGSWVAGRGCLVVGFWVVGRWGAGLHRECLYLGKLHAAGDRLDRLLIFKLINSYFLLFRYNEDGQGGHLNHAIFLGTRRKSIPNSGL